MQTRCLGEVKEVRTTLENNDTDRRRGGKETKKTMAWSGRGKKPPSFRVIKKPHEKHFKGGKEQHCQIPQEHKKEENQEKATVLGICHSQKDISSGAEGGLLFLDSRMKAWG